MQIFDLTDCCVSLQKESDNNISELPAFLKTLNNLKVLDLVGTNISPDQVNSFKDSLPETEINF